MKRLLLIDIPPFDTNLIIKEFDTAAYAAEIGTAHANGNWIEAFNEFRPDLVLMGPAAVSMIPVLISSVTNPLSVPVLYIAGEITASEAVRLIKGGVSDIIFQSAFEELVPKIISAISGSPDKPKFKQTPSDLWFSGEATGARALLDNCMEGILITIPDGGILLANPAACEIFGRTEQELIGKDRLELVAEDDPNVNALLEKRRATGRAKGEVRFTRKDGSVFPSIVSSVIFEDINGEQRTIMIIRDISKSHEYAQQLTKTKNELIDAFRRLNKTLEASQDIICSIDRQGRFVNINKASEETWGYTPDELIGSRFIDFVTMEDSVFTEQTERDIKNGNPVSLFENSYVHKSGNIVHMMWSATWDEEEQLIYATGKDITEKKRLEKICNIEQARFLDLYNMAPCCLGILKGPDHIYEMANPLYLELFDRKSDIIGKSVKEVFPELESQGIYELLDKVYYSGESFVTKEMHLKFFTLDNCLRRELYLDFMYMPHRSNEGDIDGILVFVIDVTEQVESRRKVEESAKLYHNLIMELPVAAYSCDAIGKIEIYNKAAAKLWGREPAIGTDMWCGSLHLLTPDGDPIRDGDCPMAIALKEGRTVSGIEIIMERPNGERRNILPHVVPYFNVSGEIVGAVNMLTDITDAKKWESNLKQQNEELSKANKELDRFVYSVSHDLRAPLTSIVGIARFIEEESKEPETVEHIKMIMYSINRLDGFIRKILDYSKNNRTGLDIELIHVGDKMHRIINSLQNIPMARQIDFRVDIAEDFPFATDRPRFTAILDNLIANAIKYNNPASEHKFIEIAGRVTKENFHFTITDNGIGIPTEFHEKIFDMFFRISPISEGSGIGLYIVKDMVEKLDGVISVKCGGGLTTFDITLKNFHE